MRMGTDLRAAQRPMDAVRLGSPGERASMRIRRGGTGGQRRRCVDDGLRDETPGQQ